MRILVQRVSSASVTVAGAVAGRIENGLLVFIGVGRGDTREHADYMLEKIVHLRIFEDQRNKMNLSLLDVRGALLVISQFTLHGDIRRGRRPSFDAAAPPEEARKLYEYFLDRAKNLGVPVQSGVFQEDMKVSLVNDGPVTIFHDSIDKFRLKADSCE